MGEAPPPHSIGARVRIRGLASRRASAYNGKLGTVTAWDSAAGRVTVSVEESDESLPLRLENVEELSKAEPKAEDKKEKIEADLSANRQQQDAIAP